LGFDSFEIVRSSKFGAHYSVNGVDPLLPSPVHVSSTSMYQKQKFHISKPFIHLVKRNTAAHEWARCLRWEKELFINVDGLVFPCPWFNSGYQQNDFVQKYKDRMSIKTRTLQDILDDPMWDEFITRIELMPLDVCKIKCKDCRE
jgi:MoaA/NifB/PqqE/SkfB family radical SAM enzyme